MMMQGIVPGQDAPIADEFDDWFCFVLFQSTGIVPVLSANFAADAAWAPTSLQRLEYSTGTGGTPGI
jgi:hypothetical protein